MQCFGTGFFLCGSKTLELDICFCFVFKSLGQIIFPTTPIPPRLKNKKPNCADCPEEENGTECCGQGDGSCRSGGSAKPLRLDQVLAVVCYSCMRTVLSSRNLEALPKELRARIQVAHNRAGMRKEIEDYLL